MFLFATRQGQNLFFPISLVDRDWSFPCGFGVQVRLLRMRWAWSTLRGKWALGVRLAGHPNEGILISSLLPLTEQNAIREQLDRILADHLFRNSKRFPDFLRYTVEHALSCDTEDIKERTLGIEVFGRDPVYNTSLDPVVRMTAAEVRKRLAQYYQSPGHEHEARIHFPLRSYIPEFRFPTTLPVTAAPAAIVQTAVTPAKFSWNRQSVVALLISCIVLSAFVWSKLPPRENALDRFWAPVEASTFPILLCVPDMDYLHPPSVNPSSVDPLVGTINSLPVWYRRNGIDFGDTMALATLTSLFGSKGHGFRIRRAEDAQLQDLQEGPVVLIGGRSNQWTIRLESNLRFTFAHDGDLRYISDRQSPVSRNWSVLGLSNDPDAKISEDYALITRVFDPITGHQVVTSAGILQYGTEAAAQCLADRACLARAEQLYPGDWKRENVQIVIGTAVIGENAGKPRVLNAFLW